MNTPNERNHEVKRRWAANSSVIVLFVAFVVSIPKAAATDEPFFKKDDVIAIVGGEDMVAMSEYGYLELLLTRALPEHRLKFRNLAWEGDTVFEQRRDLNFPPLEAQLDQVGATVVICQFGQMESLAGKEKLPEFVAAYEMLLARMSGGGKRRIAIIPPLGFEEPDSPFLPDYSQRKELWEYPAAIKEIALRGKYLFVDSAVESLLGHTGATIFRDAVHLCEDCQPFQAIFLGEKLLSWDDSFRFYDFVIGHKTSPPRDEMLAAICAKDRLWFDYWRVQNWAFLAGDRTEQPSSRDHVDRTKRWFPAEREQFLPLIDAKEQEIWALAAKLAQP